MTQPDSGRELDGSLEQERRVALILARARRELAARDVVTFAARAWSALLALGSLFGAVFGASGSNRRREPPPSGPRTPTSEE